MYIRKAQVEDIPRILALYDEAHEIMRLSGNPTQWPAGYPGMRDVEADMQGDALYVCAQGDDVLAVFSFAPGPDATYAQIDGAWQNERSYWVVHRIASRAGTGAGRHCLRWACERAGNVRIDTHEKNAPMRHVLDSLGFVRCGIIICENGTPRVAYQYVGGEDLGEEHATCAAGVL